MHRDLSPSNATGAYCLLAFYALWFPTGLGTWRVLAWITGVRGALMPLHIWTASSGAGILEFIVFPCSLRVGASFRMLAIGLGQRTLRVPLVALAVPGLYGVAQLPCPAFQYMESRHQAWLIAAHGPGMIGKLALFLAVESTLRSWSLSGYEGRHANEW